LWSISAANPIEQELLTRIKLYIDEVRQEWRLALQDKLFWGLGIISIVLTIAFFGNIGDFLEYIESRPGCVLNDAILNALEAHDMSGPIFFIIYAGAALVFIFCLPCPWTFLFAAHIFLLQNLIRALCMYFTPLEPSPDIIPLHDPLLLPYVYRESVKLKDLFFSGHTATLTVYCIVFRRYIVWRRIFKILTVLMGVLLLIQHCHYTIDILGAVPMSYFAYLLAKYIWKRAGLPFKKTLLEKKIKAI